MVKCFNTKWFVFPYLQASALILWTYEYFIACLTDTCFFIKHSGHVTRCSGNESVRVAGYLTGT